MIEKFKYQTLKPWNNLFAMKTSLILLLAFHLVIYSSGCVSDKIENRNSLTSSYQQSVVSNTSPQREDPLGQNPDQPLGLLKTIPPDEITIPEVEFSTDPNTGQKIAPLTIEQVVARALANSPEIRVVSFNPSIAKQDITKAASEFDVTAFSSINYDSEDNPPNSIYQPGQSDERTLESGIRKKTTTGSEWSLSYALTRNWDDLSGRPLPTRYEPILGFQLRQPLLRDAWKGVTLAGVDIAKLNYEIALLDFRKKAEDITTQVISTYWQLMQARRNSEIYQGLLNRTQDTFKKVQGRREIDATDVHIKQTEAYVKVREAALLQIKKQVVDAQDVLIRLMGDSQLNVFDEFHIVPSSEPSQVIEEYEVSKLLEIALQKNPVIQQAKIGIEIADINIRVAENQDMPRLDLVTSARTQGLAKGPENAHDNLNTGDYVSYGIGLSLEYPLGNRQREAELIQRRIKRRQAIAGLQNVADQLAELTKEKVRKVETNYAEIQIQKEAVEAAQLHLQVLEDSEVVLDRLTPEFLLVKLQAQESLANAQMSQIRAITDFNIDLVELAQTMGTVIESAYLRRFSPV